MAETREHIRRDGTNNGSVFVRRNYLLGIANGGLGRVGNSLIHPTLILAAFVFEVTHSSFLVGLLAALHWGGMFLPQLHLASIMEHRTRKKPWYILASCVRVLLLAGMALSIWAAATGAMWTIALFFVFFFAFRVAQACGALSFLDIVGQTIVPRRLGSFFANRSFVGGIAVVVAGYVLVQPILDSVPSPNSYVLLTVLAILVMATGWGVFMLAHEERNLHPPEPRGVRASFSDALQELKRNKNYRQLLLIRGMTRINMLFLAFFVPYGAERLGVLKLGGIFLIFFEGGRILSSKLWGMISDRKGNRLCLIMAGLFFLLGPAAALVAPHLPHAFEVHFPIPDTTEGMQWPIPTRALPVDLPLAVYLVSLSFFAFAIMANMVGINSFMLETAPADRRPSYIAFLNTLTFPLALLTPLAPLLLGQSATGLSIVFGLAATSGLGFLIAAVLITEVRVTAEHAEPT